MSQAPLLELRGVGRVFVNGWGPSARRQAALREVSLRVKRGEAVALIGESGSGKSTLARALLRLDRIDSGTIALDGVDVATLPERAFRRRVQLVFQDPFASLNPMRTIGAQLLSPLRQLRGLDGDEATAEAVRLLDAVGLSPGASFLQRRPDELSGGQRQRVAIARALAPAPDVLVADEPTSMLDVSLRGGVLQLFRELKDARGLGLLLITHDLAAARRVADTVAVLFRGQIVETGPIDDVIAAPAHPYTRALLQAAESLAPGQPAVDANASTACCVYAARCPHTFERCGREAPDLVEIAGSGARQVRCHLTSVSSLPSSPPSLSSTSPPSTAAP